MNLLTGLRATGVEGTCESCYFNVTLLDRKTASR
jgi:hypothetical protein